MSADGGSASNYKKRIGGTSASWPTLPDLDLTSNTSDEAFQTGAFDSYTFATSDTPEPETFVSPYATNGSYQHRSSFSDSHDGSSTFSTFSTAQLPPALNPYAPAPTTTSLAGLHHHLLDYSPSTFSAGGSTAPGAAAAHSIFGTPPQATHMPSTSPFGYELQLLLVETQDSPVQTQQWP